MNSTQVTTLELLTKMLCEGWSWNTSEDVAEMATLTKGSFKWTIDPYKLSIWDLIETLKQEALNRGIAHQKKVAECA